MIKIVKKALLEYKSEHNVVFGRMITGSIAHVCYVNKIPFIAVRKITDTEESSGINEFEKNCKKASEISARLVKETLRGMI